METSLLLIHERGAYHSTVRRAPPGMTMTGPLGALQQASVNAGGGRQDARLRFRNTSVSSLWTWTGNDENVSPERDKCAGCKVQHAPRVQRLQITTTLCSVSRPVISVERQAANRSVTRIRICD